MTNEKQKMKPAFVCIDMQPAFLRLPDGADWDQKRLELERQKCSIKEVMQYAAGREYPIFYVELKTPDYHEETIRELVFGGEAVKKESESAFYPRPAGSKEVYLEDRLPKEVDTLILMGVGGSECVRYTKFDAIKRGYHIITAPDLVADYGFGPNTPRESTMESYKDCLVYPSHRDLIRRLDIQQ